MVPNSQHGRESDWRGVSLAEADVQTEERREDREQRETPQSNFTCVRDHHAENAEQQVIARRIGVEAAYQGAESMRSVSVGYEFVGNYLVKPEVAAEKIERFG